MSWKWSIIVGISAAFLGGSGCSLQPQLVRVTPSVMSKTAENDRGGASVGVAAFDVRPDQKLGIITDAHDRKVDVATTGDVAAALSDAVTQALARSGFKTKPAGSDDSTSLRLELQELSFNALKQPFDFDVGLKVVVSAKARNGLDSYDRTFTVTQRKAAGAPPSKAETTLMVNDAVGVALSDMLADQELINFLAR